MLIQTAMAGLLGRSLLCAPPLFSAAVQQAAQALQLAEVHVHFANYWVSILDSIALSAQRKLACLSLVSDRSSRPKNRVFASF